MTNREKAIAGLIERMKSLNNSQLADIILRTYDGDFICHYCIHRDTAGEADGCKDCLYESIDCQSVDCSNCIAGKTLMVAEGVAELKEENK